MRSEVIEAFETLRERRPESLDDALGRLQQVVFSFSLKVCGNREDAEDTMQETLLQLASRVPEFDCAEALAVWLYKVARTRCLMSRRKSKFAPTVEVPVDGVDSSGWNSVQLAAPAREIPEATAIEHESREQLHQAVLKLRPMYRVVLVLHDMEGLSTAETAAVLDLKEGTVRVRLHRARLLLRDEFEHPGALPDRRKPLPPRCQHLADQLSEYLDKRLVNALCQEVASHLAECERCQALLSSLERAIEACRSFRVAVDPPQLAAEPRRILLDAYHELFARIHEARRAEQSPASCSEKPRSAA